MRHIKLITYMRERETFNSGIRKAYDILHEIDPELECIVFTDKSRDFCTESGLRITNCVYSGTKYVRLLKLIDEENEECLYISIDNDVDVNEINFKNYVVHCIEEEADFSWARLMAQKEKRFISKLVAVDKLLSHNLIRPLSWKLGFGLSIPGQCFILNPAAFKDKLYKIDTFLDDLALGTYISENYNKLKVYISNEVIGYEYPNTSFSGLCKQRKRWAKGYYQVLSASKGKKYFGKICMHGFIYHGTWLFNWAIFLLCLYCNVFAAILYLSAVSVIITNGKLRWFVWGIIYQIIFPVFHIVWFFNLLKGDKNNDNE